MNIGPVNRKWRSESADKVGRYGFPEPLLPSVAALERRVTIFPEFLKEAHASAAKS